MAKPQNLKTQDSLDREEQIEDFFAPHVETQELDDQYEPTGWERKEQKFSYQTERSIYMREHPDEVLLNWQGPEHEIYEKSAQWYAIAGLLLAAIILYAVFTNSPVMAIVFLLIGLVGYLYIHAPARVLDFGILYTGIVLGNKFYHFDDIDSFWIFYDPPHTRIISLHMKGRFLPYIHIPLHQLDPVEVREGLLEFIPEKEQEHNFIDTLERILRI